MCPDQDYDAAAVTRFYLNIYLCLCTLNFQGVYGNGLLELLRLKLKLINGQFTFNNCPVMTVIGGIQLSWRNWAVVSFC